MNKRAPSSQDAPLRKWFAHPTLSIVIAIGWLLLQQSLVLPQLITAGVLGAVIPWLVDGFLQIQVSPRAPRQVLRLLRIVIWDVIVSNLVVARIVLAPRSNPQPAWIKVPMEIRHPLAQVLLASIITNTPGTVSCEIDEEANDITVHVLDCEDAQALIATIKQRYEQPLKEILG